MFLTMLETFIEYLMNPATKQRISDIDAKLGTKYTKATNDFVQAYKEGNINLKSRVKRRYRCNWRHYN